AQFVLEADAALLEERAQVGQRLPGRRWHQRYWVRGQGPAPSRSWRYFQTYFASSSVSRLTADPGPLKPSVVCSNVCGIRATEKRSRSTSTTVRLMPSTATEPLGTIWAASSCGQRNQTVTHAPSVSRRST